METLDAIVGKEFKISLVENPSTGFEWEILYSKSEFELVIDQFKPSKTKVAGSLGKRILTFKPLKKGSYTISFEYKRMWEKKPAAGTKTYEISCN